ncbi:MAG: ATP-dependent Clp protease proteolytic subunit [Erysipelotrichaceae bacterium]|nr:ATP-dependent Clp protease proteolytic subunit [Erysipelotrichaceae bacterium]
MNYIPYILEQTENGERGYDIYSRLLKDRIILLTGEINDDTTSIIVSQLLYLDSISNDTIWIYINSPGGSITSGLAIYDTINYIASKVNTICIGMAMSMAAFLLAATTGKRYALPHSEIMIHQPYGGMQGVVSDIDIQARRLLKTKEQMNQLLAIYTNQSIEKITKDTERDYYMSAKEALEYHIIDEIITKKLL